MVLRYLISLYLLLTLSLHAQVDKDGLDKLRVEALLIKELRTGEIIYDKEASKRSNLPVSPKL
jgi:hypothetical protein